MAETETTLTRTCNECRYFIKDGAICAAPQLVDLARLVYGKPLPGASLPAFQAKLNQSWCGKPGWWFAPDVPASPSGTEDPISL
jgi:hypothetical protein